MPVRHTSALHSHRCSRVGTTYFVTCCTRFRGPGLTNPPVAGAIRAAIVAADAAGDVVTEVFTVMPDHVHWLFTLGGRLSLGRLIARLKARTGTDLAAGGIAWQRDFFEHRLRDNEKVEPFALYVFLNPYRAALVPADGVWLNWWCPRPDDFLFTAHLNRNGSPPVEWIGVPVPVGLPVGE